MRFRKKPVVIEAVRWTGETLAAVAKFTGPDYVIQLRNPRNRPTGALLIATLEGDMRADKGDWIIKGIKGEFYPCKPDIFAATYEPAEEVRG